MMYVARVDKEKRTFWWTVMVSVILGGTLRNANKEGLRCMASSELS